MHHPTDSEISRRSFMMASLAGAALAGLPEWFASEARAAGSAATAGIRRQPGANDRINIGVIGPGGSKGGFRQGLNDTRWAASKPGVKVVAACDVDRTHRDEAAAAFGPDCAPYDDFRELLARKDIDAVVIGTPDHWHAAIAAAAVRAGKDVYCEKPLTLTIDQGKQLVRIVRQRNAVFQVGSQQRSDARFRLACELVRNGRVGKLRKVTAHLPTGPTGGPFAVKPVPSDFNFDMWLGPAPAADYLPERTHGSFRWWLDYSGGMLTDWGAHHNDIAQWGIGADGSGPASVQANGHGPIIGVNCYSTFPEFDVTYEYPDGVTLLTTNKGENGVDFEGDGGSIFVSRDTIRASDPRLIEDPLPSNATRLYVSDDHMADFLSCMRSRKRPICDVEIGHRSVTTCHLANISLRLGGRRLQWDPEREEFGGDAEANAMLARPVRHGWKV
ncbi:MAG: Gfo/Idh/MocA family oxidoreductase [Chthonomonadales bacterium]|nr:Gfo/Idh/MocA family oxidoreductase [Chthonomonadales bacterium]